MNKDKFIYSRMGWCWHEPKKLLDLGITICNKCGAVGKSVCSKCGQRDLTGHYPKNLKLTTWEGFGKLWKAMKQREDWDDFYEFLTWDKGDDYAHIHRPLDGFINPTRFRDAVYDFFCKE